MRFEMDYYQVKAMNASAIKAGAVSMAHMAVIIDGPGKEQTPSMRAGSLAHMTVLEPLAFDTLIRVDVATKAAKEWKQAVEIHGEDNVIKTSEWVEAAAIAQALHQHPDADRILASATTREYELFWQIDGHDCKAKVDALGGVAINPIMVEYKTCSSLAGFTSGAARMHYHLQLGWYWLGVKTVLGVEPAVFVIAQEQAAPYDVACYQVPIYCLPMWADEAVKIARRWWAGERGGAYPGVMSFELPGWADYAGMNEDGEYVLSNGSMGANEL
jgi:hypothetical protein